MDKTEGASRVHAGATLNPKPTAVAASLTALADRPDDLQLEQATRTRR